MFTPNEKEKSSAKLKQISGRVKGISKMINEDRDHEDVLMQLSAIHESLRVVTKDIIKDYLEKKALSGLNAINKDKRESTYKDLMTLLYKYVK